MIELRAYEYFLTHLNRIGSNKLNQLIKFYKNAENLYFTSQNILEKTNILTKNEIDIFFKTRADYNVKDSYEKLKNSDINFITVYDDEYPYKLKCIEDAPFGIFYMGKLPDDNRPSVAIIGARACSSYGRNCATKIASDLAFNGIQIISGMAYGIDSISQTAALNSGGYSAAILGTGIDVCYPASSLKLYNDLKEKGCVISEYPMGEKGNAWHFPLRNRIISGLSDIVLVVEAKQRSGSLITVDYALNQGKEVFAVPGRINDVLSYSCNRLISQGAQVATNADDILTALSFNNFPIFKNKNNLETKKDTMVLETEDNLVYSMIYFDDVSTDELVLATKLPAYKVSSICARLELMGLISQVSCGSFIRK